MVDIWLWQSIISPHMAGLAMALARHGCDVTYVAEQPMTDERAGQGWAPPSLDGVRLVLISSEHAVKELVASAPLDSIHICAGIRSNGLIGIAQDALAKRRLRQWIVMETVDDAGWRGVLKRLEYSRLFRHRRGQIRGVLAIGHATPAWISARGIPAQQVFPFAYFLQRSEHPTRDTQHARHRYRFLFVGQFIERKRLDYLIDALGHMPSANCELAVVGSGPLEDEWRDLASKTLPGRVDWIGRLPLEAVPLEMAKADCLVLPSRHDGWGAVVSEALMAGIPVVCSDACGSAGVVRASGQGGVFRSGDREALLSMLKQVVAKGRLPSTDRRSLASWAECLGDSAGAAYLLQILDHVVGHIARPSPPWLATARASNDVHSR